MYRLILSAVLVSVLVLCYALVGSFLVAGTFSNQLLTQCVSVGHW